MKLGGAAFILLSAFLSAWRVSQEMKKRLAALRSLSAAFDRLHAELSLRLTSLPLLTEMLAQSSPGAAGVFFEEMQAGLSELGEKPFSVLWRETVYSTLTMLSEDERYTICRLGDSLGRYELGEQLAAIELCRIEINRSSAVLSEAIPNRMRLAYGLFGAAGALLCIMLIS